MKEYEPGQGYKNYNPHAYHYKIVWPYEVPPVCTKYWTDEDWTKYIRRFKPEGYRGHETDKAAWKKFNESRGA